MRRAPTLAFLLVTIFIDALGLGLIVPIGPGLLTAITGNAGRAAQWSGLINASYGLAQFLVVPLLGRMADRYGRRPVLVLALTLLGLDYLVHAVANSAWLFLLAHGLAGAFAGTTTAVNAAVADITEPGRRPQAYGRINAAFGVGFIAGPAVGGLLAAVSLRLPFYVAAGLAFANALYGRLIVPESRPGDGRTSLRWRLANPVSTIGGLLESGRLPAGRPGHPVLAEPAGRPERAGHRPGGAGRHRVAGRDGGAGRGDGDLRLVADRRPARARAARRRCHRRRGRPRLDRHHTMTNPRS